MLLCQKFCNSAPLIFKYGRHQVWRPFFLNHFPSLQLLIESFVINPIYRVLFLTTAVFFAGCGGASVVTNPAPVEVTFNVKRSGAPVTDLTFNLQPIAEGGQALGPIENGVAKLSVMPGTYTYYVTAGKAEAAFNAIPEAYRGGARDRKLEISSGSTIDIALD